MTKDIDQDVTEEIEVEQRTGIEEIADEATENTFEDVAATEPIDVKESKSVTASENLQEEAEQAEVLANNSNSEDQQQETIHCPLQMDEKVVGTVSEIGEKHAVVTVANCDFECIIPISELSNINIETVSDVLSIGDQVELIVIKIEPQKVILSKRKVTAEAAWQDLEVKFNNQEIIETEILDIVKGGAVVDVGVRGFIPASMLDDKFVEDLSIYKGQTLPLKIIELDKEKNHLILSHREVLREQKAAEHAKNLEKYEAGQTLTGTVMRLTDFGAFVLIEEGIEGLVHVSQISHEHVDKPIDVLSEGEEVSIKILSIDPDSGKISLSIKETLPGSWEENASQLVVGNILEGTVKRLTSFGAFVEIFPNIEGLVHISQISYERVNSVSDALEKEQKVNVKILNIDSDAGKVSLSIKETLSEPWEQHADQLVTGNVLTGIVKRIASFGAFVELFPGVEGLVHISQISHQHINSPKDALHEGETVQVKVLSVNFEQKKISLSIKELLENEFAEITDFELPEESTGFSLSEVFGDKLKAITNKD